LREVWLEFAAGRDRLQRAREQEITSCWLIAALSRAQKLPPLRELLTSGRRQTPQEQHGVMQQIAAVYGLRLEFRPKTR
jgi:hypothetical protein